MVHGHMKRMILCSEVLWQVCTVLDRGEHVHVIMASKLGFWTSKIFLHTSWTSWTMKAGWTCLHGLLLFLIHSSEQTEAGMPIPQPPVKGNRCWPALLLAAMYWQTLLCVPSHCCSFPWPITVPLSARTLHHQHHGQPQRNEKLKLQRAFSDSLKGLKTISTKSWTGWPSEVPYNSNNSMILWF